jgi:hypothetical protein
MSIRLKKIAEKDMGETTYNGIGKNTYLPAPGPSNSYPVSPRGKVIALIFVHT